MTTWGSPKKRSKVTTTAKRAPAKSAPSNALPTSRRGQASAELREAIEGREHEFAGIGFIAAGLLLGLAIYVNLAGPLVAVSRLWSAGSPGSADSSCRSH